MQEDRGSNVGGRSESASDAGSGRAERLSEGEIELRARSMRKRAEEEEAAPAAEEAGAGEADGEE